MPAVKLVNLIRLSIALSLLRKGGNIYYGRKLIGWPRFTLIFLATGKASYAGIII